MLTVSTAAVAYYRTQAGKQFANATGYNINSIGTDAQTALTDIAYLYWSFSSPALSSLAPTFYSSLQAGNWTAAANALINSNNTRLIQDGQWLQTNVNGMKALNNPAPCSTN